MSSAADDLFRWEDLDQRLLLHKTNDLAEEMHKRAAEAERRIAFETAKSGNAAGYLPRFFDFHEQLTDEWAGRLYMAYCEACTQQNGIVSASFIREVRDRVIAPLIAARKSSVYAQVCLRGTRINEQPNSAAMGEWLRRMDRLAARWNRRLEADAVATEYRAAKALQISRSHLTGRQALNPEEPISIPRVGQSAPEANLGNAPADGIRREAVIRKVQNPQANTILSVQEAALYFEVQPRTVHRWEDEGYLKRGARRGSITIESIRQWQKKRSRKRPPL